MPAHEARVVLRDGMHFEGLTDDPDASQFAIHIDADSRVGGQGRGVRPAKLILVSLAGCMAMDVISILRKKQQQVSAFEVRASAERAAEHPKVYTAIRVTFTVTGRQIDTAAVARAIELSYSRYCPIAAVLRPAVSIQTDYEIIAS